MIKLLEVPLFEDHLVKDLTAEPLVRERLLELGISPGRTIKVLQVLPAGGALILQAGNLFLAVRKEEAEHIWVEK